MDLKTRPQSWDGRQARGPVRVHIEELVLHGFASGDRRRIAAAVELELARLMGEGGRPGWRENPPALDRMAGGTIRVKAGAKPEAAGTDIARAVVRSLRQHARASAVARAVGPRAGGRRP